MPDAPAPNAPERAPARPATLEEVTRELRRPFTDAAVKFKIQTNPKRLDGSALCVCFIDARLAAERLNAVAPGHWSKAYVNPPLPAVGELAGVGCRIKLKLGEDESVMEDVGTATSAKTDMGFKGAYSDAFKRAAVGLGVGVSIYAVPQMWLSPKRGEIEVWQSGERNGRPAFSSKMTPKGEAELRRRYREWLASQAVREVFGEPLSHGDLEGAQGDIEADGVATLHGAPDEGLGDAAGAGDAPPDWAFSASEEQLGQAGRAAGYMLDGDADAVQALFEQIQAKLGDVIPVASTLTVGLLAAAVKKKREAAAGEPASTTTPLEGTK